MEEWRPVRDYEGVYEVSNLGRVRSVDRNNVGGPWGKQKTIGRIKAVGHDPNGYTVVALYLKDRKMKMVKVHRMVAQSFIANPQNKPCVNHKNGIKTDNRVENLEWNTNKENMDHAWATGLKNTSQYRYYGAVDGEKCWKSKIKEKDALDILKNCKRTNKSIAFYANKHGLSESATSHIVYRRSWKYLDKLLKVG
jgi:hypothetical protein